MEAFAVGYIILIVLAVVLAIAWTLLPFAMFGTKPLLRELIEETRESNRLLAKIAQQRVGEPHL